MKPYRLGWIKDRKDTRDHLFRERFMLRDPVTLPSSANLRSGCSPVEDQGKLGSCTANALVGALEFLEIKAGSPFQDLSRLFVYYNERDIERTTAKDSGAQIRDGIKSLAKLGVCKESSWPYDISRFRDKPTDDCFLAAGNHQIIAYQRLKTLDEMKACMASGFPVVFGWMVYASAMTDAVKATGNIPMPSRWEQIKGPEGGHASMQVGFIDKDGKVKFRNSWSEGWGDGGYGTLDYEYVQKYGSDFWAIQRTESDLFAMVKQQEVAV